MAPPDKSVRAAMLAAVPSLRAFAISLCGNVDRADDLVQEALLRAWGNLDSFEPGTNMSAWLFTILRNVFRSEYRKRRREVEDADGSYAKSLTSLPGQTSHLEMDEFRKALDVLPSEQRESLILVGASGFSYEEAAQICGCAVGTIKSRVNRARRRLAELLSIESADDFGPDRETRAVVGSVAGGLVTSLNRPSANLTGVSPLDTEMVGKRLELCHQLVPAGCWNICHPPVRTRRPADRGRSPWPTQVS
jgi:RNA polymerase sigma-70 factor, ECF subfamily